MLKVIKIIGLIVIVGGFFSIGQLIQAKEIIHSYKTNIVVNENGSLDITENIEYDFGELSRHGIERVIPVKYSTSSGKRRNIQIRHITALMDGHSAKIKKTKNGSNLIMRIGDPKKTINGKHLYTIKYEVFRALNYFTDHTELYWNAIGDQWSVNIEKGEATVIAPQTIKQDCFSGKYGDTTRCSIKNHDSKTIFQFNELSIGEFATIVIGIQPGIIQKPGILQKTWQFLMDNWILFWPVGIFIWAFQRWWKFGRDPAGRGTIIPYYDVEDDLSVAEVSAVIYNQLRTKDISAMIIQLAIKGCLKIKQEKIGKLFKHTGYILMKNNKPECKNKLSTEESTLLSYLFSYAKDLNREVVSTDDLKNNFYTKISSLQKKVIQQIKDRGYLPKKSEHNGVAFILVAVVQIIILGVLSQFWGGLAIISGGVSLAILIFFAVIMGHRTKQGVEMKEKLLGLKMYLETAEKDRLKFHNAPAKNPKRFEKLLPYAMVFGVEEEWAEQFKDIYKESPDWYQGSSGQAFNSLALTNSLHSFSKTASRTAFSSPSSASSGGSGFSGGGSGGGFGGGGGGSW